MAVNEQKEICILLSLVMLIFTVSYSVMVTEVIADRICFKSNYLEIKEYPVYNIEYSQSEPVIEENSVLSIIRSLLSYIRVFYSLLLAVGIAMFIVILSTQAFLIFIVQSNSLIDHHCLVIHYIHRTDGEKVIRLIN